MQKLLLFFGTAVLLVIFTVMLSASAQRTNPTTIASTSTEEIKPTSTPTPAESEGASNAELTQAVMLALKKSTGTYGIAIKNLETGEFYYSKEHQVFEAASLYKLWVMAEVYNKIATAELHKDQKLSESIETLNNKFQIASDTAELKEGTITLSVGDALNRMITFSDNYAALLLTTKIKLTSISAFLRKNGLVESAVGNDQHGPTTTAYDIALFLKKLYNGELAGPEYTAEMIGLLKAQKLNDKLPKYLPEEVDIAHKTGELYLFSHDAGIVYAPGGNYIIAVLSESDYPPGAEARIASISKNVYEYFETKK